MDVKESLENETITTYISGEIDGSNVSDFETALKSAAKKAPNMILDLGELEYVSSAGLRVFLLMQKLAKSEGRKMIIKNVNEDVMEIFTVTGFVKLLAIE